MFYCAICGEAHSPETPMYHAKTSNLRICVDCVLHLYEKTMEDAKEKPEIKKIIARHKMKDLVKKQENIVKLPTPKELKEYMDEYVIGQESAKRTICVAVYNHYKRVQQPGIEKSNILMIGPTGSGKTLLAKTIAQKLDVPFAVVDATTLTQAGYIGDDVESILVQLLRSANGDVSKAEKGIVFLDEFDKLGKRAKENMANTGAIGEGVQQALLKMLEGNVVNVPIIENQGGQKKTIRIDTRNILFICGGAFDGLEKIVEKRKGSSVIGFESLVQSKQELDSTDWMKEVTAHDLVKYGIIPELIGRLPVITALSGLDTDALVKILTVPKNSIVQQYKKLFELDGVELLFEEDALRAIAQQAQDQHTGARGLRGIMEDILTDLMFEAPSDPTIDKIIITEGVIKNGAAPQITRKKELLQTNSVKLTQKDAKKRQKRSTAS